ncbi:MAG: domain S-box protein [Mucilaginibacter sp.]|nr:domain S-box protein [Mucilaginibacter sp.]
MENAVQERMFEALFKQTTNPISVVKADAPLFTIVAFNEQYKKTSGTANNDIIGKAVFDVYKPWDKASEEQFDLLKAGLMNARENRQQVNLPIISFVNPANDGLTNNRTYWQFEITPILGDSGAVEYLMCVTRNVTDQELIRLSIVNAEEKERLLHEELKAVNEELAASNEELTATIEELTQSQKSLYNLNNELEQRVASRTHALAVSENRFRSILNALPQIAWTYTLNGEVDFYNQRWYDYTGLSIKPGKISAWESVIHPEDVQYCIDTFNAIVQSNKPGEFEAREKGADNIYRWHLIRMQPVFTESGFIEHWIGTATEIDALKQLQQQKEDFITIASHELKTPITTLKATLQLLDKMKDNLSQEMAPKLITQSRKSMQKISTLVDDLLNVSRLQHGSLQLNKTTFIVSELLNACCNPVSVAGTHTFHIKGDVVLQVCADEHRIDQVIVNLVNNAVKYAPDSKDVYIIIEKEENIAKVSIKDNGPGIALNKLPYLFNRYIQVDSSGYQNSGLGLGLYISSEIIKRHGGEIGVDSELGKGCTFWFTLPL